MWSYTSTPPTRILGVVFNLAQDVFMVHYLVKHRDNFTSTCQGLCSMEFVSHFQLQLLYRPIMKRNGKMIMNR
jgi:hypothetical protein